MFLQKRNASTARVEPENTYVLRVQNRRTVAVPKSNTEVKTNDPIEEKRLKLIAEFDANSRLHPSFGKPLRSSDSESEMGSNNSISNRQNIGMVVIVYGSATLAYIQLMLLAACLQTADFPPGLVFLVISLAYIAYIVFKVRYEHLTFIQRISFEITQYLHANRNFELENLRLDSDLHSNISKKLKVRIKIHRLFQ